MSTIDTAWLRDVIFAARDYPLKAIPDKGHYDAVKLILEAAPAMLDALDAQAATIKAQAEDIRKWIGGEEAFQQVCAELDSARAAVKQLRADNARLTAENAKAWELNAALTAEREALDAELSAMRTRCAAASDVIDWVCGLELDIRGGDSAYLPDDGLQKISYALLAKAEALRGPQPAEELPEPPAGEGAGHE